MNAVTLTDLAMKTHPDLRGRVEKGKSGGGNAYGYSVALLQQSWSRRIHMRNPCDYWSVMTRGDPSGYRTTNWKAYDDALRRDASL